MRNSQSISQAFKHYIATGNNYAVQCLLEEGPADLLITTADEGSSGIPAYQYALEQKQYNIAYRILSNISLDLSKLNANIVNGATSENQPKKPSEKLFDQFKSDIKAIEILLIHGLVVSEYMLEEVKDNEEVSNLLFKYCNFNIFDQALDNKCNQNALESARQDRRKLETCIFSQEDNSSLHNFLLNNPQAINWLIKKGGDDSAQDVLPICYAISTNINNSDTLLNSGANHNYALQALLDRGDKVSDAYKKALDDILKHEDLEITDEDYNKLNQNTDKTNLRAEFLQLLKDESNIHKLSDFIKQNPNCVNLKMHHKDEFITPLYYAIFIKIKQDINLVSGIVMYI